MKKLLILALTLYFIQVNAQEEIDRKAFYSLSTGASVPFGNLASNAYPDGGFGTTGLKVGVEGAWFFADAIGAFVHLNINFHPVDVVEKAYQTLINDAFMETLGIRSDPYKSYSILGGAMYRCSFGKGNHGLYAKIGAGATHAISPYQVYSAGYFMIGNTTATITSSYDWSLGMIGGISYFYNFNDYVGVKVDAEFQASDITFGFTRRGGDYYTQDLQFYLFNITPSLIIYL